MRKCAERTTSRRIARSHADAFAPRVRKRARCSCVMPCKAHCDLALYLYRPQPVRVETCPAPRLGCTGGAALSGAGIFGYVSIGSKLLIFRLPQSSELRRLPSQLPGRVQSGRPLAVERKPSSAQSGSGDLASVGGGGTVDLGKGPLGHACDSVAPDPGDPRAERLLGQRPGKEAAELSGPWQ